MKILGLTGFLGQDRDFDPLYEGLRKQGLSFSQKTFSVSSNADLAPQGAWDEWSRQKASELQAWKKGENLVGVGYSLGGRLLLSLIEQDPSLFDGAVFLSVQTGLKDERARLEREKSDAVWADKFLSQEWGALLHEWNAQAVFQGSAAPERLEKSFSRPWLAQTLQTFSLSKQPDYQKKIAAWEKPQLWMAGERDQKFVSILRDLEKIAPSNLTLRVVPQASHRLDRDQPEILASQVAEWVRSSRLC